VPDARDYINEGGNRMSILHCAKRMNVEGGGPQDLEDLDKRNIILLQVLETRVAV
jgi:hypothetical protein